MDGLEGIIASKLALEETKLKVSVEANLLKKSMEIQEEILKTLLQSMGIGRRIDVVA